MESVESGVAPQHIIDPSVHPCAISEDKNYRASAHPSFLFSDKTKKLLRT